MNTAKTAGKTAKIYQINIDHGYTHWTTYSAETWEEAVKVAKALVEANKQLDNPIKDFSAHACELLEDGEVVRYESFE